MLKEHNKRLEESDKRRERECASLKEECASLKGECASLKGECASLREEAELKSKTIENLKQGLKLGSAKVEDVVSLCNDQAGPDRIKNEAIIIMLIL